MADYQKPNGFRFQNGGFNVRYTPDALTPNKYVVLKNVRETSDMSLQTRPGMGTVLFGPNHPITDIKSYATLGTDAAPRFLARDNTNLIILDNNAVIVGLAGTAGNGVTMMPFRPNASFQSWMYIAAIGDYRKFSAPSATNAVTVNKVGTQEGVIPIEFAPQTEPKVADITSLASGWTAGGTAAAPTFNATLLADNSAGGVGGPDGTNYGVIPDPVVATRWSVGVATNYYLPGMLVTINTSRYIIANVLQPIPQTTIAAIRYDSATFGPCNILINQDLSNILDRGSIIVVDNGTNKEAIFVQSCIPGVGASATCQIRTQTVNTYTVGNNVFGELTIVVSPIGGAGTPSGQITIQDVTSSITVGLGTLSQNFSIGTLGGFSASDYVHLALFSQNGWSQATVTLIFNVGVSGNFTNSIVTLTASIPPTPGQSILINVPISAFVPASGFAVSLTQPNSFVNLASAVGVQIQINNTGPTTVFGIIGFWVAGQGGPDVGYIGQGFKSAGAPYRYACVPRASTTGVVGNPTPLPFYGANPHRSTVLVKTSNLIITGPGDTQCDTIDVYRSGGSITSFQYIGSVDRGNDFVDSVTDAGASAGQPLQFDNFEPWPTIDVPFSGNSGIDLKGTTLRLNIATPPATILNWLPGTLVTLSGLGTFALRTRPVLITGTTYQFEFTQNAGTVQPTNVIVNEPNVANQHLPFIAGPDANGFFWAVGDPLRPGTAYFSKAYQPDSAPQVNTFELCPPSEPLMGVEIIRGVTYICSTKRWWAMYPNAQFTSTPVPPLFNPVEQAIGETFAAAWGHTSNGQLMAYWGKRGIYTSDGNAAKSITDADLLPLFPHDGIAGVASGGLFPPDYTQSSQFRLNFLGNYLYADYVDTQGTHVTLVYNIKTSAWISNDVYSIPALTHYAHEQPEGAPTNSNVHASYSELGLLGGSDGNVYQFKFATNDAGPFHIPVTVQTFEWDGGDARADMQFGDGWIDCTPVSTILINPTLLGATKNPQSIITSGTARILTPFAVGQQTLQKFMGISLTWIDDFSQITSPTTVYTWQLSVAPQVEAVSDRATDWYNLGQASYVRGVIMDLDTNNQALTLNFTDETGATHPLTFTHNGRQELGYAFTPPFVAHLIKLVPPAVTAFPSTQKWRLFNAPKFISDPYPEITPMLTSIMLMTSTDNSYVQGIKLTADSGGVGVSFNVLGDGGAVVATIPSTVWNGKQTIPIVFPTPFKAHNWQLQPFGNIRIFDQESKWIYQSTPESMTQWGPTQFTSHGLNGYHFLYRLEVTYSATAAVTLTVTSFDGTSPQPLVLPSTGGATKKTILTFTPNKGTLYQYLATSASGFQLFLQDWRLILGQWSKGLMVISNLGGMFGDKAEI